MVEMADTVFISGATSGIGEATARLLAAEGYRLIITGRRKEKLNQLHQELIQSSNSDVLPLCFDVRDEKTVTEQLESLPDEWKKIDILINNAGLAAGMSTIPEGKVDDWERMIDTNVKGLLYVTRIIASFMVKNRKGHIVNISSIAGKETYPMGNVYCATKYAVQAITQGLRIDLLKYGIKVSSVCPGAVNTEFSLVRFNGDQVKADAVYSGFKPLYAEDIAQTILFIITRPPHVNIDDILVMPTAQAFTREFNRSGS